MRIKFTLEYDGTNYHGWQFQEGLPTIQGTVEAAMARALGGQVVSLTVAGRTDAGVHALGQVAHGDFASHTQPWALQQATNHYLKGKNIVILSAEEVAADFHARFSAQQKEYAYHIINRRAPLTLQAYKAWHVPWPMDCTLMQEGANYLLGYHDFTSFRASQCQAKNAMRTLDKFIIEQAGPRIACRITAKSFLHHQVRNMVGTLLSVATHRRFPSAIKDILEAKDRTKAGITAPAHGLYLNHVLY